MGVRLTAQQKEVILQFKSLDSSHVGLDALLKTLFLVLQKEISFRSGWFFPVDPVSLKTTLLSHQSWSGPALSIDTNEIILERTLLPDVEQLMEYKSPCIRGEDIWTPTRFTRHPFYKTILLPAKLYFSLMVLLLDKKKKCRGYLVLWREKKSHPFSQADIALMTSCSTVLGNLLQNLSIDIDNEKKTSSPPKDAPKLLKPITRPSNMSEDDLHSLVRRRAQPGILIIGKGGEILYLNYDAKNLMDRLTATPNPPKRQKKTDQGRALPQLIYQLYDHFRKMVSTDIRTIETSAPTVNRICIHEGAVYLFRALLLQRDTKSQGSTHIMILIEKVSEGVHIEDVRELIKLTQREQIVVQLLSEGKTNKEIAVYMDIGEYTVKDHMKRIMKKLNVTTRAGIVAKILQNYQLS
ncbi:MAG: response regulator transcription factor [Nitrospiria bacterium]